MAMPPVADGADVDVLPYGRQEEWQDSPQGWPQSPAYSGWLDSPDVARLYGAGSSGNFGGQ
ncbi:hypothetical protein [Actinoplanes solisilvae]|uniref:hypothetical protein n=1 Tax=Actinoplanes solisilvae TaxID=2486853 RepID=UPI000FDB74E2|nr:hypothetical protein [Actinoplanes solisilvae]